MSMLTFFPITSSAMIAKQACGGGAERLHDPADIDHDHGVRNGVEDRLDMRLASQRSTSCSDLPLPGTWRSRSPTQAMPNPSSHESDGARSTRPQRAENLRRVRLTYSPVE